MVDLPLSYSTFWQRSGRREIAFRGPQKNLRQNPFPTGSLAEKGERNDKTK